jgi:hypothetical protein
LVSSPVFDATPVKFRAIPAKPPTWARTLTSPRHPPVCFVWKITIEIYRGVLVDVKVTPIPPCMLCMENR